MPKVDLTQGHHPKSNYKIEIIAQTDIPAIIQIEQLAHDFPWSQAIFESNFGEKYLNLKICAAQEVETLTHKLIGHAITQVILDEATLFNIAISPDFQRLGYAKVLLIELTERLKIIGVKTLWLEVRESNLPAIRLYEQLGFNEVTIRKGYYPTKQGKAKYDKAKYGETKYVETKHNETRHAKRKSAREDAIVMAKYL